MGANLLADNQPQVVGLGLVKLSVYILSSNDGHYRSYLLFLRTWFIFQFV